MDLSQFSAKKIIGKIFGIDPSHIILLRLGGWIRGVDSPAFQNGLPNTPDPAAFDASFPQLSGRFQATIMIVLGNTPGRDFNVEIEESDIEALIAANPPGTFNL